MRRIKLAGFTLFLLALTQSASAGWMDKLEKLADPTSKESQILSGSTQVLASSKEIDYPTERTIGESLGLEGLQRYGLPLKNDKLQKYVNLVGTAVARNSNRATIPYRFAVLDSPLQNAFAAPGGIIFVSRGLLETIGSEAELAAVLAHEVGHVAAKHALRSIRRAQFLQGVGTLTAATMKGDKGKQYESMIGDMQQVLFDKGLDKQMEYEADLAAMETAYRTGYDPAAMVTVLEKLQAKEAGSEKAGSWYSTHPPLDERISRLKKQLKKYPDHGGQAHGVERFRQRVR